MLFTFGLYLLILVLIIKIIAGISFLSFAQWHHHCCCDNCCDGEPCENCSGPIPSCFTLTDGTFTWHLTQDANDPCLWSDGKCFQLSRQPGQWQLTSLLTGQSGSNAITDCFCEDPPTTSAFFFVGAYFYTVQSCCSGEANGDCCEPYPEWSCAFTTFEIAYYASGPSAGWQRGTLSGGPAVGGLGWTDPGPPTEPSCDPANEEAMQIPYPDDTGFNTDNSYYFDDGGVDVVVIKFDWSLPYEAGVGVTEETWADLPDLNTLPFTDRCVSFGETLQAMAQQMLDNHALNGGGTVPPVPATW